MKKHYYLSALLVSIILFQSCQKVSLDSLSGYVQKGPYINGTAITISELNKNLGQTGKSFTTQIEDNKGSFRLNDIELASPYIEIRADGFYFNEVTGEKSESQLTLFSLADVSDQNSVNVNILTQLEKGRVEYLIEDGLDFKEAKEQAQAEVLNIFGITNDEMPSSESLDISKDEEENAILLAISLIVQGNQGVGDLTELLADITADIREDGTLDNPALDSLLHIQATTLDQVKIRATLEDRFESLGIGASIGDFESYINHFLPVEDGIIQMNLQAYYPFKGNAIDESLFGNHGTVHGATLTVDRLGNSGYAYHFNGIDNYIVLDNTIGERVEKEYTIAMWVKVDPVQQEEDWVKIFSVPSSPTGWTDPYYNIATTLYNSGLALDAYHFSYVNGPVKTNIPTDSWEFVVFTFNNGAANIYLNGVLADSKEDIGIDEIQFPGHGFSLGARAISSGSNGEFFTGDIDELLLYNRELSVEEVLFLYDNMKP